MVVLVVAQAIWQDRLLELEQGRKVKTAVLEIQTATLAVAAVDTLL
jgi:hypothetical protein